MSSVAVKNELSPEHQLFVNEYLKDFNAAKAAERAGFGNSYDSARQLGFRLLTKVHIRKEIQKAVKRRLKRIEAKQDDVVNELALIALSDVNDYSVTEDGELVCKEGRRSSSRVVQSIKHRKRSWLDKDGKPETEVVTEFKLWDKLKALELLMKHMGMLKDEVTAVDVSVHHHEGDTINYNSIHVDQLKEMRAKLRELGSGTIGLGVNPSHPQEQPV